MYTFAHSRGGNISHLINEPVWIFSTSLCRHSAFPWQIILAVKHWFPLHSRSEGSDHYPLFINLLVPLFISDGEERWAHRHARPSLSSLPLKWETALFCSETLLEFLSLPVSLYKRLLYSIKWICFSVLCWVKGSLQHFNAVKKSDVVIKWRNMTLLKNVCRRRPTSSLELLWKLRWRGGITGQSYLFCDALITVLLQHIREQGHLFSCSVQRFHLLSISSFIILTLTDLFVTTKTGSHVRIKGLQTISEKLSR